MSGALRHSVPHALEVRRAAIADDGTIRGYASTWGNTDSYGDRIEPGAFAASLAQHKADGSSPALLWAHDQAAPIGHWTALAEDSEGLRVEGRLALGVEKADEAAALLRSGARLGLSIGFALPENGARYERGGRVLTAIDLHEISIVACPANRRARLELRSIRELEEVLRDAGLPRTAAARLAARGWPGIEGRDAADEGHGAEIAGMMQKHIAELENLYRRILQ